MKHVEITEACRVLFGPEITVSPDFIAYLQPAGLKSAYRQLALLTHPDRAECLGLEPGAIEHRFRVVHSAYETLKPYVMERRPLPPFYLAHMTVSAPAAEGHRKPAKHSVRREPAPAKPPAGSKQADFFFTGSLPRTPLRLGQFLFYRRKISWWSVVHAMVWQQRHRPRIGELARKSGWLNVQEAHAVQQAVGAHELWGAAAIRCGVLDSAQVVQLLARQRQFGKPIGRYFVEQGLLGEVELGQWLAEQQRHNRAHASVAPRGGAPTL